MAINIDALNRQINEVVQGIEHGDFDNPRYIPDAYTYGHLIAMFYAAHMMDGGKDLYENLYTFATTYALNTVRKKTSEGKLKVAFLTMSAAMWQAESVYRLLEKDDAFETYIVVAPGIGAGEAIKISFRETYEYFRTRGYDVRAGYSRENNRVYGWEDLGGLPDIIFHMTPYYNSMPSVLAVDRVPLKVLNVYIPYGMDTVENRDYSFMKTVSYNSAFMNLVWRIYTDSVTNVEGFRREQLLRGRNAVYSGFPKMDYFYTSKDDNKNEKIRKLWKTPKGKNINDIKRVIIAPHHSVSRDHVICFSTFPSNMYYLLDIAKQFQDQIAFVLKPHPHLRHTAVENKLFPDVDAYNAYLAEWEKLENARVVEESDYLELFSTSDAMIMDCGSFIGEYLYADKPLLFLTRPEQAFSELGEKCMTAHYQVPGDHFEEIRAFLEHTVLEGDDPKAEIRKRVFDEELNYCSMNNTLAADLIYREIKGLTTENTDQQS